MAPSRRCAEKTVLPWKLILPTLTFGPSTTMKVSVTEFGGILRVRAFAEANSRPCSASNCSSTTSARLITTGSYCDSMDRPTFRSLKRSSTSDWLTVLRPL